MCPNDDVRADTATDEQILPSALPSNRRGPSFLGAAFVNPAVTVGICRSLNVRSFTQIDDSPFTRLSQN